MIKALRTVKKLWRRFKSLFFNTLYLRIFAFVSLLVISFHDFLVLLAR